MEENKIKINKNVLEQVKLANSIATQFREPLLKFSEIQEQIQESLREPILRILEFQNQMRECFSTFTETISIVQKHIKENLIINIPKINIDFKNLSERRKELAIRMIKNGWYFSFVLPLDAYKLLDLNNPDFNSVLVEFYEQYEEDMINKTIEQYPHRKKILFKAYEAHKRKDYELSIPVMLAQSDGIAQELFNKKLFSKNKIGRLATEEQNKIIFEDNPIDICFFIQLATVGQLNENYNPPTYKNCKKFNRHTVLHGKDINYARKINSIKCLVMLNFLAEIKEFYYEDKIK